MGELFLDIFKFAYMGKFRWPYRSVPIPTTFRPANIILQPQPQPQPAEQVEDQTGQAARVEAGWGLAYWVGLVEVEAGWGWGTAC